MKWKLKLSLKKAIFILTASLSGLMAWPIVAFADSAEKATSNTTSSLVMFGLLFAMMYFFMIRPQSKRNKEHKALISSITKGDEIVLSGGLFGTINQVAEQFVVVTIASGVDVKVQKQAIISAIPRGTLKSM